MKENAKKKQKKSNKDKKIVKKRNKKSTKKNRSSSEKPNKAPKKLEIKDNKNLMAMLNDDDESWEEEEHDLCRHCATYPCEVNKWLIDICKRLESLHELSHKMWKGERIEEVNREYRKVAYDLLSMQKWGQMQVTRDPVAWCCVKYVRDKFPSYTDNYRGSFEV